MTAPDRRTPDGRGPRHQGVHDAVERTAARRNGRLPVGARAGGRQSAEQSDDRHPVAGLLPGGADVAQQRRQQAVGR
ncbi:hypothetical protein GCM10010433_28950 [Streptomyces pulveraceus]|uniref:Uncharacterized protein n=1 Tax=Streptomyces pulveraceus TaxID=68258 RepID=A0ABW1GMC9_9ACTN